MAVKHRKTKKYVRTRSKGEKPLSITLHGGVVIATARGKALKLRVVATAKEALSSKLKRGDHILFGGNEDIPSGYPAIPYNQCDDINCGRRLEGVGDDIEISAVGNCKEPCDCVLYGQKELRGHWIFLGKERVKLDDFFTFDVRCRKAV